MNPESEWQKLYRRAFNCASGLTDYIPDRPGLTSIEKEMAKIEAEARALEAASTPIAWVVAVEEQGAMKVYGPQYNWLGHAEQDAELPRKRGQKAEVWACYPVADQLKHR